MSTVLLLEHMAVVETIGETRQERLQLKQPFKSERECGVPKKVLLVDDVLYNRRNNPTLPQKALTEMGVEGWNL